MLLSFLPANHSRLGSRIEEALDLPLIQQQAENGVLDIGELSQFIIWTMGSLCAPCRDEDIKRLKEITDVVPLLRSVKQMETWARKVTVKPQIYRCCLSHLSH